MVQNGGISDILPIDSLWSDSTMAVPEIMSATEKVSGFGSKTIGLFILAILVVFFFFGKNLAHYFKTLFLTIVFPSGFDRNGHSSISTISLFLLFLVFCPICAALAIRYEFIPAVIFKDFSLTLNFLIITLAIPVFFISRKVILFLLSVVCDKKEMFSRIFKLSLLYFIFAVIFSLMPLPFTFISGNVNLYLLQIVLCSVIGAGALIYLLYVSRLIISSQFSVFFWFLYLCSLEILPVTLVITTMVRL